MALIQLDKVSLSFGLEPLLDETNLTIQEGERLCLIGRNGTGKTSLLSLLLGTLKADSGEIRIRKNLKISILPQDLPEATDDSIFDFITQGMPEHAQILSEYHQLSNLIIEDSSESVMNRLAKVQNELEAQNIWHLEASINFVISRLGLDADQLMSSLSGGNRRMVALAQALVHEPDLLLLDEPTNHLDIDRIEWLEQQLPQLAKSLIFITHDRQFADRLATRIIELDRGKIKSYPGNFRDYYKQKEHEEAAEENERARFDKKLAREEAWIRQGIKARRTRNEGRVRALQDLRQQRKSRRNKVGKSSINITEGNKSGKLVAELTGISKSFSAQPLINNFDFRLMQGDRLGILGSNGSGKSTLVKLILGELEPDTGTVKLGTKLEVAYFDQTRQTIDSDKTVAENIADGNDYIEINGKPKHVLGYLQEFMFSPARARTPAKALSGGEYSRLLIAKLLTKPSNLLILDEPTNDLDMETLEILEAKIADYKGTLILISHDRAFIDNTVTSIVHLDGNGSVTNLVGGYSDWLSYHKEHLIKQKTADDEAKAKSKQQTTYNAKKLSYNEQRELDQLPDQITALEEQLTSIQNLTQSPDFYQGTQESIEASFKEMTELESKLEVAFDRWEELSSDGS